MSWIGWLVAIVAGVLGIGLSRDALKRKYHRIQEYHLDIVAFIVLVIALAVSAIQHFNSVREIEDLRGRLSQVRSFEAIIRAHVSGDWDGGRPPDLMSVMVDHSRPIAFIDIRTQNSESRRLELFPTALPKISPADDRAADLLLQTRARPGDWIYDQQIKDLLGSARIDFLAWGLKRSSTHDGRLQVLRVEVEIFTNGVRVARIEKVAGQWLQIPKEQNKNPTLSLRQYYPFKAAI
ncbi:MAG: hypothetical protein JSW47_04355 [Phycisphaerales bacterium]|nr:MAG: hypothetical protein JSW47_04355 [Phycisphaerales bacterium]UCF15577.1 MAG: hypothetical protein JSW59_19435 [Phycisphaerales bacterium]